MSGQDPYEGMEDWRPDPSDPEPDGQPEVSREDLLQLLREHDALKRRRLLTHTAYPKQQLFHTLGATKIERCFMAGNRVGKSESGGCEGAVHATGLYPAWWQGRRWERPTRGIVCGISNQLTREVIQMKLLGPVEAPGTGFIPADRVLDIRMNRGVPGLCDTLLVRHTSGGTSFIKFLSYEQGRLVFQGHTGIDWIWCDEEPPEPVYSELLARISDTRGMIFLTFTPLLGGTNVVDHFFPAPDAPHRALVQMEIDEAEHIPAEERARIIAAYPAHEREARAKGIPTRGSGAVYPVLEDLIKTDPIPIPRYWRRIVGIDFGWTWTAAGWLALNPDSGVLYLTDCYKQEQQTPVVHAAAIKARGDWIPVSWPQDAYQHDKGSGIELATQYREQKLRMLREHAQFSDGSNGVEAGVMKILDLMKTGRFKVFSTCTDWFSEMRSYYRKEGEIVKRNDHLMDATRYALMMLRHARTEPEEQVYPTSVGMDYDPLH